MLKIGVLVLMLIAGTGENGLVRERERNVCRKIKTTNGSVGKIRNKLWCLVVEYEK